MKQFSRAYDTCCLVAAFHKCIKQGVFFLPHLLCCSLLDSEFSTFPKVRAEVWRELVSIQVAKAVV